MDYNNSYAAKRAAVNASNCQMAQQGQSMGDATDATAYRDNSRDNSAFVNASGALYESLAVLQHRVDFLADRLSPIRMPVGAGLVGSTPTPNIPSTSAPMSPVVGLTVGATASVHELIAKVEDILGTLEI